MSESTSSSGSSGQVGPSSGVHQASANATSILHSSSTSGANSSSFGSAVPPAPASSPRKVAVPVLVKDGKTLV